MSRSYLWLVAAAAVVASSAANATPTVQLIGIRDGNPGTNCGTGLDSTFLSSTVAEFTFDGVQTSLGTGQGTSCTGGTDAGPYVNSGTITPNPISTALGNIQFSGTGEVTGGTDSGLAAAPWADNTAYLAVPGPDFALPGSETLDLSALSVGASYFGIYWGSIDSTNVVSFTLSDGTVVAISGADLPGLADTLSFNGVNQTNIVTNVYADFVATGGATIESVTLSDTGSRDFELDNLAFGNIGVPAPGAFALLGLGLGLIGLGALRRQAKAV